MENTKNCIYFTGNFSQSMPKPWMKKISGISAFTKNWNFNITKNFQVILKKSEKNEKNIQEIFSISLEILQCFIFSV